MVLLDGAAVVAVHAGTTHAFSKCTLAQVELLAGLGVRGDAHCGERVQHRSRVARDPTQPNLRQVHLLQAELFDDLAAQGFVVAPGQLGENITTRGVDLLALPEGSELQLGPEARVRLTGLRNPCAQIDAFQPGLMAAVLSRTADGALVRKAGAMAIVLAGGTVRPHDAIGLARPASPHRPLRPV